jgi:hypothetical protein
MLGPHCRGDSDDAARFHDPRHKLGEVEGVILLHTTSNTVYLFEGLEHLL